MLQNLSRLFLIAVLVLQFPIAEVSSPEAGMSADTRAAAPSKLCHPKKPVTCRANDLAAVAPTVAPTVAPVEQQAALCVGPKWLCRTGTELTAPVDTTIESQQAALCVGPKWLCRTGTELVAPAETDELPAIDQQAALCVGPKWLCRSSDGLV